MKQNRFTTLVSLLSLFWVFNQSSQAFDSSVVDVHGFGSGGFSVSGDSHNLDDYSLTGKSLNFTRSTLFGLNIHSSLTSEWDVVGQLVAKGNHQNFDLALTWGFAEWKASSSVSVRLGRLVTPLWLYSQEVNVAYNYPWVILPAEAYGLSSILSSINGISILTQKRLGSGVLQAEILGGEGLGIQEGGTLQNPSKVSAQINNALAGELSYDLDRKLVTRIGYGRGNVSVESDGRYISGTSPLGIPTATQTVSAPSLGLAQFYSAGFRFDDGKIFLASEWVRRLLEGSSYSRASAAYGSGGVHIGRWLPLLTYAASYDLNGNANLHPDFPNNLSIQTGARTWSLGFDWNASDSVVCKAQYNRTHLVFNNTSADLTFSAWYAGVGFIF